MKLILSIGVFCLAIIVTSFRQIAPTTHSVEWKEKLSEYSFFEGKLADQQPAKGVLPYSLNTPLFSDYAEKLRFVQLPSDNANILYNDIEVLDFPVGTTLIKTFFYPIDFRNPALGRKLIETRLLIHNNTGWQALTYIWNDEQTDAYLEVAGDSKMIAYTDYTGKIQNHSYTIPNVNQCKGCHNRNEKFMPIGPSVRQLNGSYQEWGKTITSENQLTKWQQLGIINNMPPMEQVPKTAIWNKPETGTLNDRARAYLDINCAHCHRPDGPANTSGLDLRLHNHDLTSLGIQKAPVAAGRGSGNRKVDILPTKPHESILFFRMDSADPGIMMPELGRSRIHKEGVALIKEWIEKM